jgi:hypothetical protein
LELLIAGIVPALYNLGMRAATIILTSFLAVAPVLAQDKGENSPQPNAQASEQLQNTEQKGDKRNQRIERIRVEDEGSRVDELRVGGETKNITVQPKVGNLPAYEVQPQNAEGADGTNGRRVWRALQF